MKKIIVYDFDKTLTTHDTLFGFFRHCAKKELLYFVKLPIYIVYMFLAKAGIITNTKLKETGVKFFLYAVPKDILEQKARNYKSKIIFNHLYKNLEYENDTEYFVVSASFEEYLKPIFPDFVTVIGSKLEYRDNQVTGLLFNCYKEMKKDALESRGIEKITLLFTDSYSDVALAKISEKTVVVKEDGVVECESLDKFKRVVRDENFNI